MLRAFGNHAAGVCKVDRIIVGIRVPIQSHRFANSNSNNYDPTGLSILGDYAQKVRDSVENIFASIARLGTALQNVYASITMRIIQWMRWIQPAFCIASGFVVEGPDLPACEYVPDDLGDNYRLVRVLSSDDDSVAAEAAVLRRVAEIFDILDETEQNKNIGYIRYSIDGIERDFIWAVSGKDDVGAKEMNELLTALGFRVAPDTSGEFVALSVGRAYDTEVKLLNEFVRDLDQIDEANLGKAANIEIELYTERRPCPSCEDVINKFIEYVNAKGHKLDMAVYYTRESE